MVVSNHHGKLVIAILYVTNIICENYFSLYTKITYWYIDLKINFSLIAISMLPNIQFSKFIDNSIFAHNCKYLNRKDIEQSICK